MNIPRIYCQTLTQEHKKLTLDDNAASHVTKVLRLKPDNPIDVFNGKNLQCRARLISCTKHTVEIEILGCEQISRESPLSITLIQAISKGDRMDWTLQKATELGVSAILPFFSKRSVVKLDDKRLASRMQHWQGIVMHACEQCGRNQLPTLLTPVPSIADTMRLDDVIDYYVLEPEADYRLKDLNPGNPLALIVGPEGGFDDQELDYLHTQGVRGLRFGPRILRTETAGVAVLAALGALAGDL